MRIFLEKSCKIAVSGAESSRHCDFAGFQGLCSRGSAPRSLGCYSCLLKQLCRVRFGVERFLLFSKITEVTNSKCSDFASFVLLRIYFSLQTLHFLLVGAQKYFLPRGVGYPRYATVATINWIVF